MGGVGTGGMERWLDVALEKSRRQENSENQRNCEKVVNIWPEELMRVGP